MKIRAKFNIALAVVFVVGFAVSALISYRLLLSNAKEEVLRNAGLMMETAMSVRGYTIDQIKPQLDPMLDKEFLPQTVPAFAAIETFERLQKKYPDFTYREATLNPTNQRDHVAPWEEEVVARFRNGDMTEIVGERTSERGPMLYIARPIQIKNAACLTCHSNPNEAPASLRAKYGDQNGFGWKLEEVVGAQIISVPVDLPVRNAEHAFITFSAVLVGQFVVLFILLNVMLTKLVVNPIARVSQLSDEISKGNLDLPEFEESGTMEIKQLHASFNRMRRSIEKAMKVVQLQKEMIKKS